METLGYIAGFVLGFFVGYLIGYQRPDPIKAATKKSKRKGKIYHVTEKELYLRELEKKKAQQDGK